MFRLALYDYEHVFRARERWEDGAHSDALKFRKDSFSAVVTAVIDEIIGVPSSAVRSHLSQQWPHVMGRALDCDGVLNLLDRIWNQVVAWKPTGSLAGGCACRPAR